MNRLAAWLRDEAKRRGGLRAVQRLTGVGLTTLSQIANDKLKGPPELSTLVRLSEGLQVPLDELVTLASGDPPGSDEELLARLGAEAALNPELTEILRLLREAPEEDRRAVLKYLRGALGSGQ